MRPPAPSAGTTAPTRRISPTPSSGRSATSCMPPATRRRPSARSRSGSPSWPDTGVRAGAEAGFVCTVGVPGFNRDVTPDPGTWHTLRLACREPFDGQALLRFLAMRAIPAVEEVSPGRYARTVRVPGGSGIIELVPPPAPRDGGEGRGGRAGHRGRAGQRGRGDEAQVLLRARITGLRGVGPVVSRCRRLFDLD